MRIDIVNIDNGYIYFADIENRINKVDLNGSGLMSIVSNMEVSSMNVYDGWIYFVSGSEIHKIKTDGTEDQILKDGINDWYHYLNILGGQLYYYNSSGNLCEINLESASGGDTSAKPISIKKGEKFSGSTVIEYQALDVNGDGTSENVILTGDYTDYYYNNLKLFVQDSVSGKVISNYSFGSSDFCENVGNSLSSGDFNGDKTNDVMVSLLTNQQRGTHTAFIFTLTNNELNKIFDDDMVAKNLEDFNYQLKIYKPSNEYYYLVDLNSYDSLKNFQMPGVDPITPGITIYYETTDADNDGILELQRNSYIVGVYSCDFLCRIITTYKFNKTANRWDNKDLSVTSEDYPCQLIGAKPSVAVSEPVAAVSKPALGKIREKDGWIYYIHKYYESYNSNGYNEYSVKKSVLYKIKEDGSESQKLVEDAYGDIELIDNWIYYISKKDGGKLHKIKLDGSSDTAVSNDEMFNFKIAGDYIYFNNYSSYIYKMKLDGTQKVQVTNDKVTDFNVFGDYIYYTQYGPKDMYKIKVDGSKAPELIDNSSRFAAATKDSLYYLNDSFYKIYKMNLDGTGKQSVYAVGFDFIADEDYLYYVVNNSIYRLKFDGTESTRTNTNDVLELLGKYGDWIYYISESYDNSHAYRINIKDGSKGSLLN